MKYNTKEIEIISKEVTNIHLSRILYYASPSVKSSLYWKGIVKDNHAIYTLINSNDIIHKFGVSYIPAYNAIELSKLIDNFTSKHSEYKMEMIYKGAEIVFKLFRNDMIIYTVIDELIVNGLANMYIYIDAMDS